MAHLVSLIYLVYESYKYHYLVATYINNFFLSLILLRGLLQTFEVLYLYSLDYHIHFTKTSGIKYYMFILALIPISTSTSFTSEYILSLLIRFILKLKLSICTNIW